jgi:membrane-bound ClpP family serine protease
MISRLIVAIVTTLLYELALIAVVLWGLPRLGIYIPIPGLVVLVLALGAVVIATYRKGSQALRKKAVVGLTSMIGSKAKAVSKIDLEGMVKVKGELWKAQSTGERIDVGEEVTVVGQKRLKLIVHRDSASQGRQNDKR